MRSGVKDRDLLGERNIGAISIISAEDLAGLESYLEATKDTALDVIVAWKHHRRTGDFPLTNFLWERAAPSLPHATTETCSRRRARKGRFASCFPRASVAHRLGRLRTEMAWRAPFRWRAHRPGRSNVLNDYPRSHVGAAKLGRPRTGYRGAGREREPALQVRTTAKRQDPGPGQGRRGDEHRRRGSPVGLAEENGVATAITPVELNGAMERVQQVIDANVSPVLPVEVTPLREKDGDEKGEPSSRCRRVLVGTP